MQIASKKKSITQPAQKNNCNKGPLETANVWVKTNITVSEFKQLGNIDRRSFLWWKHFMTLYMYEVRLSLSFNVAVTFNKDTGISLLMFTSGKISWAVGSSN